MIADEKQCRVCKEYYPITHFYPRYKGSENRVNICRDCQRTQRTEARNIQRESEVGGMSGSYSPEDPWGDVACAVLRQAVLDWNAVRRMKCYSRAKNAKETTRSMILLRGGRTPYQEMSNFFNSDWFEVLCGVAGYDPEWIREKLGVKA